MIRKKRTGSKLKTTLIILMVPTLFVLAMNLFWFGYSTTRISVEGRGLASVKLRVNEEVIDIGNLRTGETRFMFLPKKGQASYILTYVQEDYTHTACEVEVEETKQHVEALLYHDRDAVCTVTEPMFSGIMVTKFF